jgi:EAL domain-containing protein (putative c-di-GMP-specific phosphodiesterase class I)/GGDEF domain-containing protein
LTVSLSRFVGFAFASADLLIELDRGGRIAFAAGAGEALSGAREGDLMGRQWREFIDADDQPMVEAFFSGLEDGARGGPLLVRLAGDPGDAPRGASLSAFRLPQNGGAVSCVFTRAAAPEAPDGGLYDRTSFEDVTATLFQTAKANGLDLELALLELGGFANLRDSAGSEEARTLQSRLAGALRAQSHGGSAAADLGEDRYAVVRRRGESPDAVAARLVKALDLDGSQLLKAQARTVALNGDASPRQVIRAIRYAVDSFIADGLPAGGPLSLSDAVSQSVRRTVFEVGALSQALAERQFTLVYQPVVDLRANAAVHHHEVLVRFGDGSPFPMIRMAEELDLIESLDMAVVEQSVDVLSGDASLKLAVNVSGRTIQSREFLDKVLALLKARPAVRGRLLFELTESAAIDDLRAADANLALLRAEGCKVCLDDFGAGAASLAYLQQLNLDLVKIDGRYIRELQHGGRETTFLRHLVSMCAELGVKTVAEMIETREVEEAVRSAGVDYGQGWLYGAALPSPQRVALRSGQSGTGVRPALRRAGAEETWG